MTCSTRCSSRPARSVLAAALLAVLACSHGAAQGARPVASPPPSEAGRQRVSAAARAQTASEEPLRVAILPLENTAGQAAPVKELRAFLERRLATRVVVVTGPQLEEFLSRHRLRYTGGIDAEAARAGRDELGLDAFLITTLEAYRPSDPPTLGLSMRLVSTGDEPVILWMDHAVRGGEDHPRLLRLGVIQQFGQVRDLVVGRLLRSLEEYLRGERTPRDPGCSARFWYRPKVRYRSTLLDDKVPHTLAVLPFLNQTPRRGAGDLVALELVRQIVRSGRYRVLEPGVVRDFLLRSRIIMPGGVSLETTRLFLGALGVDMVVSGVVFDYLDSAGSQGPTIRFSATMLDGGTGEVLWHSSSANRGDDGVFMFGLGRVRTASELTCRMVARVVDRMGRRTGDDAPPHQGPLGSGADTRAARRPVEQEPRRAPDP